MGTKQLSPLSEKTRLTLYLPRYALLKLEGLAALTGKSRNELVADAIDKAFGEITTGMNHSYLCDTYGTEIKATIEQSETLLRKQIFRVAVEANMANQLAAGELDLTKDEYNSLRAAAIKAVEKTRGE